MSKRTHVLSRRTRRLAWLVFAAVALSALGVWFWNQRPSSETPQQTLVSQADKVANSEGDEHAHTNRLVHETSPYLLQHAHNPVNWHPWGKEAFEKAKREDKPIFLSVGYSTCYWCHVMEKESFEDAEVAAILNEHFVAIKVDREERPDVDEQYMLATQLITQRGGWPNSVWLTPEGKPWMAGTYFPKPQFIQVLNRLAELWQDRRADVVQQADALAQAIRQVSGAAIVDRRELTPELVEQAAVELADRYEPRYGGFGGAPKFPPHGTLQLLIHRYREVASGDSGDDESLLKPITHTLDAMWLGGLHDHVGGGFHRYSTDQRWLLPHFEKMLYDNAQLIRSYTDGYLIAGHERYREAVADIFRWVRREMTSPGGAFYSAIDSGEVGKEGEAYVWHIDEVNEVLGAEDAPLFTEVYNFEKHGNFTEESSGERPGTNIPHLSQPIEAIAKERGEDPAEFAGRLQRMRDELLARRQTWVQPHKDDKVLTSWNGLMIGSLAYAGRQLDEPRYTETAARAADFILENMMRDGTLLRTYRDGEAKLPGYLDDYAYFARGLTELYLATSERRWLDQADRLAETLVSDFQDQRFGGFFFTTAGHEELILRSKHLGGGGNTPDANGVAAQVLLQLAELTGKSKYAAAAKGTLESLAGVMAQQPFSSEHLLIAAAQYFDNPDLASTVAASPESENRAPAVSTPDATKRVEPVTIEVYASRLSAGPGGSLELAVMLDIDDGWHLYGKNPDADFLVPSTVMVEPAERLSIGEIDEPEPHRMTDPILKQELNTYTGRIRFHVPVTVHTDAEVGSATLTLSVKTQACDDSRCLPPQTTTLQVPLEIDPEASDETRHPALFGATEPPQKTLPVADRATAPADASAAWQQLTEDMQRKLQTADDPRSAIEEALAEIERFAETYAGTPEAAIALLNHGLLAKQLGDDAAAQRSLRRAAELTDDPELAAQIETQLRLLAIRPGEVPPDFTAPTLAGKSISLKDFRGRVVLLDFWATWCGPCIAELPNLEGAYQKHHEAGFEIVSISIDDRKEALTEFLDGRPLPWTHVFNGAVPLESSPAVQYGVESIPHTVLIGRDGKIAAVNLRGSALEAAVVKALAQPFSSNDSKAAASDG